MSTTAGQYAGITVLCKARDPWRFDNEGIRGQVRNVVVGVSNLDCLLGSRLVDVWFTIVNRWMSLKGEQP